MFQSRANKDLRRPRLSSSSGNGGGVSGGVVGMRGITGAGAAASGDLAGPAGSGIGPPGIHPQRERQLEDVLDHDTVTNGFKPAMSVLNPSESLRSVVTELGPDALAERLGANLNSVINGKDRTQTLPSANPMDLTKNMVPAQKLKKMLPIWLRDMGGTRPLSQCAKKIPYYNKKDELLKNLYEHRVPLLRAAWFLKATIAYQVSATPAASRLAKDRSEKYGNAMEDWSVFFTKRLAQLLDEQLGLHSPHEQPIADATNSEWQYTVRLTFALFQEGIVDKVVVLSWLADGLDLNDTRKAMMLLPLVMENLAAFNARSASLRHLFERCVQAANKSANLPVDHPFRLGLWQLIEALFVDGTDAMVHPSCTAQLQRIAFFHRAGLYNVSRNIVEASRVVEQRIRAVHPSGNSHELCITRVHALVWKALQLFPALDSSTQAGAGEPIYELHQATFRAGVVASDSKLSPESISLTVQWLLEWVCHAPEQEEGTVVERAVIVSRLLAHRLALERQTMQADNSAPRMHALLAAFAEENDTAEMFVLYAELLRHGVLDYEQWLQRLFACEPPVTVATATPGQARCLNVLRHLPILCSGSDQLNLLNQRRVLLYGIGPAGVTAMHQAEVQPTLAAYQQLAAALCGLPPSTAVAQRAAAVLPTLPGICDQAPDFVVQLHLDTTIPAPDGSQGETAIASITSLPRLWAHEICDWLDACCKHYVVYPVDGVATPLCLLSREQFSLVLRIVAATGMDVPGIDLVVWLLSTDFDKDALLPLMVEFLSLRIRLVTTSESWLFAVFSSLRGILGTASPRKCKQDATAWFFLLQLYHACPRLRHKDPPFAQEIDTRQRGNVPRRSSTMLPMASILDKPQDWNPALLSQVHCPDAESLGLFAHQAVGAVVGLDQSIVGFFSRTWSLAVAELVASVAFSAQSTTLLNAAGGKLLTMREPAEPPSGHEAQLACVNTFLIHLVHCGCLSAEELVFSAIGAVLKKVAHRPKPEHALSVRVCCSIVADIAKSNVWKPCLLAQDKLAELSLSVLLLRKAFPPSVPRAVVRLVVQAASQRNPLGWHDAVAQPLHDKPTILAELQRVLGSNATEEGDLPQAKDKEACDRLVQHICAQLNGRNVRSSALLLQLLVEEWYPTTDTPLSVIAGGLLRVLVACETKDQHDVLARCLHEAGASVRARVLDCIVKGLSADQWWEQPAGLLLLEVNQINDVESSKTDHVQVHSLVCQGVLRLVAVCLSTEDASLSFMTARKAREQLVAYVTFRRQHLQSPAAEWSLEGQSKRDVASLSRERDSLLLRLRIVCLLAPIIESKPVDCELRGHVAVSLQLLAFGAELDPLPHLTPKLDDILVDLLGVFLEREPVPAEVAAVVADALRTMGPELRQRCSRLAPNELHKLARRTVIPWRDPGRSASDLCGLECTGQCQQQAAAAGPPTNPRQQIPAVCLFEGLKPPPLDWTWFGAERVEASPSRYAEQLRLASLRETNAEGHNKRRRLDGAAGASAL
eukprot:m.202391 g.202391  ORF g.202391 m.202391 type:complete len:1499 (-) comp18439_c0_seq6:914-5410(-)